MDKKNKKFPSFGGNNNCNGIIMAVKDGPGCLLQLG